MRRQVICAMILFESVRQRWVARWALWSPRNCQRSQMFSAYKMSQMSNFDLIHSLLMKGKSALLDVLPSDTVKVETGAGAGHRTYQQVYFTKTLVCPTKRLVSIHLSLVTPRTDQTLFRQNRYAFKLSQLRISGCESQNKASYGSGVNRSRRAQMQMSGGKAGSEAEDHCPAQPTGPDPMALVARSVPWWFCCQDWANTALLSTKGSTDYLENKPLGFNRGCEWTKQKEFLERFWSFKFLAFQLKRRPEMFFLRSLLTLPGRDCLSVESRRFWGANLRNVPA